ncbi:PadR family transcriptional regulator [Stackebrandtia nassauensis]|uniref:Transcriptional regulator, PadR-like family n=1 Tax=Stackebrandtia nassauensis (strain DSM 44728 / CIP 108903 / NRRL B-16338 / NBRC 102104 / LLR-40K-21) TaxID=446470 RepID=D3Q7Z1_STANL|nr:PadR family transcriptional regulator [Stackebrandtia nassauensis]ADD40496.1 transcriptional regulator, PadR-like family [Stackebrandtia nassauensis DSM 44728]
MWTSRLLILGLVRWLQPVHGYDVRRELMSWKVDEWGGLKPGSIYHGLKKLAADGCLEVVATEQVDNRPARTTYRVTAKGEQEFQTLLRDKLWGFDRPTDPFFVAWSFLPVLGPREAAAMLRNRAAKLRDEIDRVGVLYQMQSDDPRDHDSFIPPHVAASTELIRDVMELSRAWCERTADRIESGELVTGSESHVSEETVRMWKEHISTLDANGKPRPKRQSR